MSKSKSVRKGEREKDRVRESEEFILNIFSEKLKKKLLMKFVF